MFRLRSLLLAALVALVPGGELASSPPSARPDPRAMRDAHNRFLQLADEAERRGTLPRLADPDTRLVLQAVWDGRIVAPERTFDRQQLLVLAPLCDAGGQIVFRYVRFRTRGLDDPAAAGNFAQFQPEIAMGMEFTLRCVAAMLEGGENHSRSLPPEQRTHHVRVDLDQLRSSVLEAVIGALGLIRERRIQPGSATRIARALRESAPRLVPSLPANDRAALSAFVRDALPQAGSLAGAELEAFITALTAP